MRTWLSRARRGASFANVMSALALFIALGGTSYAAVSLSRNDVGAWHIRKGAVGKSEVRSRAVAKSEIRHGGVGKSEIRANAVGESELRPKAVTSEAVVDGGLEAADLSEAARTALAAAKSVTFRTASTAAGATVGGNAAGMVHTTPGVYVVDFGADVSACHYAATLGGVKSGTAIEEPPATARRVSASPSTDGTKVIVRTYDASNGPLDAPFHLLIAC